MAIDLRVVNGIRHLDLRPVRPCDDSEYLLLHGLGNSLHFWTDVYPTLGAVRRTVVVDIPGFGKSVAPRGGLTIASASDEVQSFAEAIGLSNCVLVAHSMGAFVGMHLAASDPAIFRKLVLVDGTLSRASELIRHPSQLRRDPTLGIYLLAQFVGGVIPVSAPVIRTVMRWRLPRLIAFWPYAADPGSLDADLLARALADTGGPAVLKALIEARNADAAAMMRQVTQPVDLVWGHADHLISATDLDHARHLLSVDRELELQGCAHWPMIESPRLLSEFILACHDAPAAQASQRACAQAAEA
jgi:pimeloyl-ACP methyl ester carboxylesterase